MPANSSLIEQMTAGKFEEKFSHAKQIYYRLEQAFGRAALQRHPPVMPGDQLLNLGCGPHHFPGWVNADQYAIKRRLRDKNFAPNWMLDMTHPWKCPDNHWDGVFTEHVLEHVPYSQAVFVLRETLRTLKPGCWVRISVPSIRTYMSEYLGAPVPDQIKTHIPHPAISVSFVTQMHEHRSTWDGSLMAAVLTEIGFQDARECPFRQGSDARILKDDPVKSHDSVYVEARKAP